MDMVVIELTHLETNKSINVRMDTNLKLLSFHLLFLSIQERNHSVSMNAELNGTFKNLHTGKSHFLSDYLEDLIYLNSLGILKLSNLTHIIQ